MENPIKMDDLGVPLFLETPIYNIYMFMNSWWFSASHSFVFRECVLGCPVGSDRINGDRINGLFHLRINGIY